MSGEFPGHSRTGIPLYSRNVLVLLELCYSARSCIKIYPFYGNTTHSHESVFHSHNYRRHCRVCRKQNEKYHAKYIQAGKCAGLESYKQQRHVSSEKSEW